MPNTSDLERECVILGYVSANVFLHRIAAALFPFQSFQCRMLNTLRWRQVGSNMRYRTGRQLGDIDPPLLHRFDDEGLLDDGNRKLLGLA